MKLIERFFLYILPLLVCLGLGSCSDDEPEIIPAPETVRRTVMVYIVATNNLGYNNGFDTEDIREMLRGSERDSLPADARWLVYHAKYNDAPRLLEVRDGQIDTLKTYDRGGSVTLSRMSAVFDDMTSFAPALSYGLVLWGHGSGWQANGLEELLPDDPYSPTPLSYGNDSGEWMNVATLRAAVKGRGFDYIYFDVCNMACVEVAYELRDAVRIIVGGPAETPGMGMPYDMNMPLLADGSTTALIEAARRTFNVYNGFTDDCAMTVIDCAGIDALARATQEIYSQTPLPHPGENVTNYFGTTRTGDYIDFGEYVNALAVQQGINADEFNAALDRVVLYKDAPKRFWSDAKRRWLTIYHSSGIATYVFDSPADFYAKGYDSLQWAKDVASHHIH